VSRYSSQKGHALVVPVVLPMARPAGHAALALSEAVCSDERSQMLEHAKLPQQGVWV